MQAETSPINMDGVMCVSWPCQFGDDALFRCCGFSNFPMQKCIRRLLDVCGLSTSGVYWVYFGFDRIENSGCCELDIELNKEIQYYG